MSSAEKAKIRRLISFVGTGDYEETTYKWGNKEFSTRFVAEALAEIGDMNECFFVATDDAWKKHGYSLEQCFDKCERYSIPDGKTESELWEQFDVLMKAITEGEPDQILVDITHGFRAQPFFAAGVLAQLGACGHPLDRVRVVYGEFRKDEDVSPVWDLSLFVTLMEWVQGTTVMRETGNGELLVKALQRENRAQRSQLAQRGERRFPKTDRLIGAIERFSDDLATVRVASLISGFEQDERKKAKARSSAAALRKALTEYRGEAKQWLPALVPMLDRLNELADGLYSERIYSAEGMKAMQTLALRYLELGRYGEAASVVREGWISAYAAEPAEVEVNSLEFSNDARERVETRWHDASTDTARSLARVRNDLQHGGFNRQPLSGNDLQQQVEAWVQKFLAVEYQPPSPKETPGKTWFVTRHPGAVEWAQRQDIQVDRQVSHLDIDKVEKGDIVLGTLPVNLIAKLNEKGVRYAHLSLEIPEALRGKELSADELDACGAKLEYFRVSQEPEVGSMGDVIF